VARDMCGCNAEVAFGKVARQRPATRQVTARAGLSHVWHMSVSDFFRRDEVCNRKEPKPETAIDRNQIYGPRCNGPTPFMKRVRTTWLKMHRP